jgi:hypothetical protein
MGAPCTSYRGSDLGRALLLYCALAGGACAPGDQTLPAEMQQPALPEGFLIRLDSDRGDVAEFRLSQETGGIDILTGPAGIAWQPGDTVTRGGFRAQATFVQYAAPVGYREAYGIFVGGSDLQGPDQEYVYLLIRPTGDYLVKRRLGETTQVLVDWTPHDAVDRVVAEGDEPRNTLAIEVFGGDVVFLVNGTEVHRMSAAEARPYGVAGVRANHRLDILVQDWSLEPTPPVTRDAQDQEAAGLPSNAV